MWFFVAVVYKGEPILVDDEDEEQRTEEGSSLFQLSKIQKNEIML